MKHDNLVGSGRANLAGSATQPASTMSIGGSLAQQMDDLENALMRLGNLAYETRGKLIGQGPPPYSPDKASPRPETIFHAIDERLRTMIGMANTASEHLSEVEIQVFNG